DGYAALGTRRENRIRTLLEGSIRGVIRMDRGTQHLRRGRDGDWRIRSRDGLLCGEVTSGFDIRRGDVAWTCRSADRGWRNPRCDDGLVSSRRDAGTRGAAPPARE